MIANVFRCSRSSGRNSRCQPPRRQTWQASPRSPRCPPGTLRRRSSIYPGVPSRAKREGGGGGKAWPRGVERLELRHEFRPGSGSTDTRHRSGKGQSRTLRGGNQLNRLFGTASECWFSSGAGCTPSGKMVVFRTTAVALVVLLARLAVRICRCCPPHRATLNGLERMVWLDVGVSVSVVAALVSRVAAST